MSRILPILFNTEMVQAILDNCKTVTRRIMKPQPWKIGEGEYECRHEKGFYDMGGNGWACRQCGCGVIPMKGGSYFHAPYQIDDILYVRETWAFAKCITCNGEYRHKGSPAPCYDFQAVEYDDGDSISDGCFIYRADHPHPERITWRPSIHMPKVAARIWLRVTDIKIQRLQEMTLDDFLQEGVVMLPEAFNDPDNVCQQARTDFIDIWDSTISKGQQAPYSWAANPWVWVIEFERCEKPEVGDA